MKLLHTINVVVVRDGVTNSLHSFPESHEGIKAAEKKFVEQLEAHLSNFDEYTAEDIANCIDDGYEKFGVGAVCLIHSESE